MTKFDFWRRILRDDQRDERESIRKMVIGVLSAALVIDLLMIIANINFSVMLGLGALVLIALALAVRGILLPGQLLVPAAGLAVLGYLMFLNKGLRDTAFLGLPVILLAASLMVGRRGAVFYGLLSLILIVILGVTEASGAVRNVFSAYNTPADYFTSGLIIVLITSLQWLIIGRLNESVRRARDNEQAQIRANQQLRELQVALEKQVAEIRRSEEALRDSEALYQSLVEILPMSVCRKDLDGRFTFVNQRYCGEFKLPASEILGKTDVDLHPADLAEKYQQDDRAVIAGGQTIELVEEHEPLGGERRYVQVFKSPVFDARGQVNGVQIVFWDVSERKQAEQQIRQQAVRAKALAELSHLLTQASRDYQLALDTVVRRCAELIGDGASVFLYEPDRPQLELAAVYNPNPEAIRIFREHILANPIRVDEGAYGHVLKTNQPVLVPLVPLEKLLAEATPERRAYYQRLPLYSAMFAPLRAHGKILGVLGLARHAPGNNYSPEDLVFLQDIADRSALAIVNAQLYAEAQERAAQLTMLNEIGHAVSALQDLDSVLELIYRQVQRIASVDAFYICLYDPEREQISFPIVYDTGIRYNEPTVPLKPDAWIAQVIRTGEPFMLLRTPEELQVRDSRGVGNMQRRSASILLVPLWHGKRVIGALSVQSYTLNAYTHQHAEILTGVGTQAAIAIENAKLFTAAQQELAERKRVQAEREQLIEELEAKNAELERFTYTVSHDLKSPLVTIRGFLGFAEKDAQAGDLERMRSDFARVREATDKMQRLLTELLELSRIGRLMNPLQAIPLDKIVHEALELTRGRLSERKVQVTIEPGLPVVHGDRVRLVEVVQNLVDNACKFMGDQLEPRISIRVRESDRDGKPIVCVQDNGIGIEPRYHEKVFGLFDKLDPKSEGTGIGLALVKRIVEVHGGRIWIESEGAGQGSTFCFTLPRPEAAQ